MSAATGERVSDLLGGFEDGRALAAGLVVDCAGLPVPNVQILVRDAACRVPLGAAVVYAREEVPVRGLTETSDDGLFVIADAAAGAYTLEAYTGAPGANGPLYGRVAAADVVLRAGEVTLTTLTLGTLDGAPLPPSCRSCP